MNDKLNVALLDDRLPDASKCSTSGLLIAILLKYGLLGIACVYFCYVIAQKDAVILHLAKQSTEAVCNNTAALQEMTKTLGTQTEGVDRLVRLHERDRTVR